MSMPKGSNPTISEIVKSLTDGEYRIPRFQRDFVWDIKKSASLIDSIFKGYPIGSVILWKTKNELPEVGKLGGIEIPGKETGRYTSYIIDGQQRLTSLYFALMGFTTGSGVDFSGMCLSLVAEKDEQIVFDAIPKDDNPDDYVNLNSLFTAKALGGSHQEKRLEYYQTLLQYTVSVIEIDDENLGIDEVIEIFERLNLGGKKLNLFSIIAARTYQATDDSNPGFDLAKKFKEVNKKLDRTNYGKISDSTFLQVISACLIGRINKASILRDLKKELIIANYEAIEDSLYAAVEHLKGPKYGALVSNLLPYQRLIVPFAYFHYKMAEMGRRRTSDIQEKYLVDYFWRSVIGKRYNSSADTNLNADIGKIQKILDNECPPQEAVTLSPRTIFENGRFALSSAFVIGMLCLMAQMTPQSFDVGRTIIITNDSVSNASKKQFHHFFPKESPVVSGNPAYKSIVNNVVNIVFMDALTNVQISNRNPADYVAEFKLANPEFSTALKSHYIEINGYGIEDNDFRVFLNARSKALCDKVCSYIIPCNNDIFSDAAVSIS